MVGVDNGLLKLKSAASDKARLGRISVEDVGIDLLIFTDMIATTHLVEVSSDDPAGFRFALYSEDCRIGGSHSFSGEHIASVPWGALRTYAQGDYLRVKRQGEIDLRQVDLICPSMGLRTVYRRLVLPLRSGPRRQVTHLLVSTVRNLQDRVPHSLD